MSPLPRGTAGRRRWLRPAWWQVVCPVLVALVMGAGIDLANDQRAASMELTAVAASGTAAQHRGPDGTVFVLALGSDERAGLGGARADALHVIGLNPTLGQATILDIPRDTWVDVPGRGNHKINEAYSLGGPQLQAETITAFTGIPIDYVLTTTFDGLIAMVDAMGGLVIDVPQAMDDRNSGAAFEPGLQLLTGEQTLALSRNRNIGGGDLTRTYNQGLVIVAALTQLRSNGTDAFDVIGYLDVLLRNVRTEVDVVDLYHLGRAALAVDPAQVRNLTMPATTGRVGSASVVFSTGDAPGVFADMADDGVLQQH